MALDVGQRVRVSRDYRETTFQGKRGMIIAGPDKKHGAEYLVHVEGGSPARTGWIHVDYLQTD